MQSAPADIRVAPPRAALRALSPALERVQAAMEAGVAVRAQEGPASGAGGQGALPVSPAQALPGREL